MTSLLQRPLRFERAFLLLAAGLTLAFLGGAFVLDAARVLGVSCLVLGLWAAREGDGGPAPLLGAWGTRLLLLATALGVLATGAHLLLRVGLGEHGIDFAIFSQAIHWIGAQGVPRVTLVGLGERNFLTHHFSPVLYLPGALAALGLPAPVAGVAVHVVFLGLGLFALHRLFREQGLPPAHAALGLLLVALCPALRAAFAWSMHDELFAFPFVVLAYLSWSRGKHLWAAASVVAAMLCKESYFLFAVGFAAMGLWAHRARSVEGRRPRAFALYAALGLLGAAAFVAYFLLQPLVLGKPFDHAGKLAGPSELLAPGALWSKGLYLLSLLAPTLAAPLFFREGRRLLLPVLPLLGLSLASRFEEMYTPLRYYAVTPLLVGFIATAACYPALRQALGGRRLNVLLLAAWFGALSFSGMSPSRTVWRAVESPELHPPPLPGLSPDAVLLADPAAALFLLEHPRLYRLWAADNEAPPAFDLLVSLRGGREEPSASLKARTSACGGDARWEVRCPGAEGP